MNESESETDETAASEEETGSRKRKLPSKSSKRRRGTYEKSYFVTPVAVTLYELAAGKDLGTASMLWACSVALTSSFALGHVGEPLVRRTFEGRINRWLTDLPEGCPLRLEEDLRFAMYRHWSLLDAITNTDILYAKVGLWKETGMRYLQRFFARVGLEPCDYRQTYIGMPVQSRTTLNERCVKYADQMFRCNNLTHWTLVRSSPNYACDSPGLYLQELSSLDMTYVLHCQLEALDVSKSKQSFFDAMDTVNLDPKLVEQGMRRAQALQKDVVAQVKDVIDRRLWKGSIKKMIGRLIVLDRPKQPFHTASSLRSLAMFLLHTLAEKWPENDVPLAICARNEERKTYLCVGVEELSEFQKNGNFFGSYFQEACEATGAEMERDRFDTAVAEVNEGDFQKWLDEMVKRLRKHQGQDDDDEPDHAPAAQDPEE